MKLFNYFKKEKTPMVDEQARELYNQLMVESSQPGFHIDDKEENMAVAEVTICQY